MENEIENLETQITYYATKYYAGEPEISDDAFDALVDKLRSLNPRSKVLKTGWGFEVNGDKVKHRYGHVGSLDKTKTYEDIPNRFKDKTIYISPKLDGLSAVVYYENGKLVKGITRGNGEYGKDITDKLRIILGNDIFDKKFTGAARGELIISDSNWNILQHKYKDMIAPRNFAAGIINRKDIDEDIKYIDLVVYKIVGQEFKPTCNNREDVLQWLKLNFKHCIPIYYYPVLNESSWNAFHEQTFEAFKQLGYGLDGLVLTNPDIQYLAHYEDDHHLYDYVYDEVAFKFQAETTTTIIKEIEWTMSKNNRYIPVAIVEPVELSGAIIQRATCNNAKWVKDQGLGKGAQVVIQRANEVIPNIMEVIEQSEEPLPTHCPHCGNNLVWEGVDLICDDINCPNVEASNLQVWCEQIGETDGLQYTIMKQYLDQYGIESIDDLYTKQVYVLNDLNTRKLSITESKILEFFNKLYLEPVKVEKALMGLNIPRLGEKTAELLAQNKVLLLNLFIFSFNNENFGKPGIEDPTNLLLDLVKDATTKTLMENQWRIANLSYLFDDNLQNNRLIFPEIINKDEIKYIAVTGSLQSMKRKDFEVYIKNYGYELSTNLKKCQFLVNNDIESTSTKNKQAKEYGVPIITEQQFLDILK